MYMRARWYTRTRCALLLYANGFISALLCFLLFILTLLYCISTIALCTHTHARITHPCTHKPRYLKGSATKKTEIHSGCLCAKDRECASKKCAGNSWGTGACAAPEALKVSKEEASEAAKLVSCTQFSDKKVHHKDGDKGKTACLKDHKDGGHGCTWCPGNRWTPFSYCRRNPGTLSCKGKREVGKPGK